MAKQIFKVVLTEGVEVEQVEWQVGVASDPDMFMGSGPMGRAHVYVANGVVASNARDAKAHALVMWDDATRTGLQTMQAPLPRTHA